MRKLLIITAALALAVPAGADTVSGEKLIVVDNRAEQCVAASRIAEGNRRRAEIKVSRLVRQYKAGGYSVRVVRLEAGDRVDASSYGNSNLLVRIDC